jgi:hypothetical protein
MSILAYPSRNFPGPPSVAVDVPEDWMPVHAPGTALGAKLPRLVRSVLASVRMGPSTPAPVEAEGNPVA